MSEENGGPAFPVIDGLVYGKGMTLRDYFAAKAVSGLCADPSMPSATKAAEIAYAVADAMLKAREE